MEPGIQHEMDNKPDSIGEYKPSGKLANKTAIITGGDSGIGRSIALLFAMEGADIAISYLEEHKDAKRTKELVEEVGQRCILIPGDIGEEKHCIEIASRVKREFDKIDILVNNAAEQHPQNSIENITEDQLIRTFKTNIFSMFFLVKACLKYLQPGSTIINTTSVTAYRGSPSLLDYSATKGAIVSFTRSLSLNLIEKDIRVNAVAPGPIWTPLIPSTFPDEKVENFGKDTPMKRSGQPSEVAPAFVFLASSDSKYMSGQVLHPNGGEIING